MKPIFQSPKSTRPSWYPRGRVAAAAASRLAACLSCGDSSLWATAVLLLPWVSWYHSCLDYKLHVHFVLARASNTGHELKSPRCTDSRKGRRLASCEASAGNPSTGCTPRCRLAVWVSITGICSVVVVGVVTYYLGVLASRSKETF